MDFNTENFILVVKKRRAIWDSKYANRKKKLECWDEIVDMYAKEDDTLEDKKKLGNKLMKKWRNIKDNFVKASRTKNKYTYYNNLLFLKELNPRESISSESDKASDVSSQHCDPLEILQNVGTDQIKKETSKKTMSEGTNTDRTEYRIEHSTETDSDDDKLFLLSLLREFKKIPEPNRLDARCEIIRVIKNAQQSSF